MKDTYNKLNRISLIIYVIGSNVLNLFINYRATVSSVASNKLVDLIFILIVEVFQLSLILLIVNALHKIYWYKFKNRKFDIGGTWYQYHLLDTEPDYLKTGEIRIDQSYFDLSINGFNVESKIKNGNIIVDGSRRTEIAHKFTTINKGGVIVGIFEVHRSYGAIQNREGLHRFQIDNKSMSSNKKPEKMMGSFLDFSEERRCGTIHLFRDEGARDAAIRTLKVEVKP